MMNFSISFDVPGSSPNSSRITLIQHPHIHLQQQPRGCAWILLLVTILNPLGKVEMAVKLSLMVFTAAKSGNPLLTRQL